MDWFDDWKTKHLLEREEVPCRVSGRDGVPQNVQRPGSLSGVRMVNP